MSAVPERPALKQRYERRRDDVVVRAAHVFAARGYHETSMQDLAEHLSMAAGGTYHYFRGKEDLLVAICDQLMDPLLPEVREVMSRDDMNAGARLRTVVRLWVGQVVHRRDHMLVFEQVRHAVDQGPQWRAVRASRKAFETLLTEALDHVELEGRGRFGDREIARAALLGMVNQTAQWYRPRGRLSPQRIADGYVDLLLVAADD